LNDCAARRADTDWHLPRLYDFAGELDATVVAARFSRYVIDVNRPPDGANLYPGRDTPKLCPGDTFDRQPLYRQAEPGAAEIERRVAAIWRPYHARLQREIARVVAEHGVAVLWDAHSIVSVAPRLFDGRLADFNLGTAGGASCDAALAKSLVDALRRHAGYSAVLDGRFKGGHITRAYGDPARGATRSSSRWPSARTWTKPRPSPSARRRRPRSVRSFASSSKSPRRGREPAPRRVNGPLSGAFKAASPVEARVAKCRREGTAGDGAVK
jgi:N-formylglutamate amidohydrolase